MFQLAAIDLAIPALSATTTFLGSAVLGYRFQRRARGIKGAIVQRVKDARALRETLADVKAVKEAITGDVDKQKAIDFIASLKTKYGLQDEPKTNQAV